MLQLGQLDAVILAQPVGERGSFVAHFAGGQVLGVQAGFELADLGRAMRCDLRGQVCAVRVPLVALGDPGVRLRGEAFLAQVELGQLAFGGQNLAFGLPQPLQRHGQLGAAVGQCPAALLLIALELALLCPQVGEPLFAFDDLDLGGVRLALHALRDSVPARCRADAFGDAISRSASAVSTSASLACRFSQRGGRAARARSGWPLSSASTVACCFSACAWRSAAVPARSRCRDHSWLHCSYSPANARNFRSSSATRSVELGHGRLLLVDCGRHLGDLLP